MFDQQIIKVQILIFSIPEIFSPFRIHFEYLAQYLNIFIQAISLLIINAMQNSRDFLFWVLHWNPKQ